MCAYINLHIFFIHIHVYTYIYMYVYMYSCIDSFMLSFSRAPGVGPGSQSPVVRWSILFQLKGLASKTAGSSGHGERFELLRYVI